MKRTISLIIAIAVMVSMFVLPASAAEYIVDMSTLNGASAFTVAVNIPIPGITLSDIGLHFQTGEPGATNGNTVDIPLDLSGYNTMVITYRNGAAVGEECADLQLQKADYTATIGTFDLKGTGSWGTTAEASIDVSSITEGTTNYRLTLQAGANGSFVTGIKLTTDTTSGGGSVTPPPASGTITAPSQFVAGTTNVLSQNIEGTVTLSSGTYVIDLAGYEWTNATNGNGGLIVSGAHVTVIDSSANKTGKINSPVSDAVVVNSGTFVAESITILGAPVSGDAIFVNGGTVVSNNSNLSAGKAGIDVVSSSASVTVNGGSFPAFTGTVDERNSAIELRYNAKVTLNGDIDFAVNRIVARKTQDGAPVHTNAIIDSIIIGDSNATATFTDEVAVVSPYTNYNVTEITYTYSAPAADPAFAGVSLTLTNGLTLNFIAEGVTASAYVMVGSTRVEGKLRSDGKYEYAFGDFGPQQMGDVFKAELYVADEKVAEKAYSVKEYCEAIMADSASSTQLVKLAIAILNYGAAAQVHKDYKANALVNAGLTDAQKAYDYTPSRAAATIGTTINPTHLWKTATVYFGDKISIRFTFAPEDELVTTTPAYVMGTTESGIQPDVRFEINAIDENGTYEFVIEDILPTDFRKDWVVRVYDANGEILTNDLSYGVATFCALYDNENIGIEIDDRVEPVGTINGLVKTLVVYGDAATAYVNSL